jgi:predicted RNase H-like nuclease
MRHAKKSRYGAQERATLLERFEPRAPELGERVLKEHRRAHVGRDDVVDALAAMLTTGASHEGSECLATTTVPKVPEVDEVGLPMCMWIPAGSLMAAHA